jgi:hypothetical protein
MLSIEMQRERENTMKRNWSKQSGIKFILFTIAVGICFLSTGHNAMADDYAYYTATGGLFGTVDLTTGSTIGSTFYLGHSPFLGIGVANGTLYDYGYAYATDQYTHFYSIDPVAQSASPIGYPTPGFQVGLIGSANNALYTAGGAPTSSGLMRYQLFSVNPSTGFDTFIDNILVTAIPSVPVPFGLSTCSNTLYFFLGDNLYTVNTSTGAGTLVGSMGSGLGIGPMVFENDTLYGTGSSGKIYTINTTTGASTLLSNNGFDIIGLAPAPGPSSTPEPTTMLLLGLGLLGLVGVRRKIKK